jgi:hypothetical protein
MATCLNTQSRYLITGTWFGRTAHPPEHNYGIRSALSHLCLQQQSKLYGTITKVLAQTRIQKCG